MTSSRWTVVILAFAAGCGTASAPPEAKGPPAPAPGAAAAPAPSAAARSAPPPPSPSAAAKATPAPPAKAPASTVPAAKASTPPAQAAKAPPPSAPSAPSAAALDLKSLEKRLKDTNAIGVMTKLSLKNQLDDLVSKFRAFHDGHRPPTLAELRPGFELMLMKVLSLVQDKDTALANDISAARSAMWEVLYDREKFTKAL